MLIASPPLDDYEAFVAAMRERRRALGMTTMELEALSGLEAGYVSKLEHWRREGFGRAVGPALLPLWLGGLGVVLQLVELPPAHPHHRRPTGFMRRGD